MSHGGGGGASRHRIILIVGVSCVFHVPILLKTTANHFESAYHLNHKVLMQLNEPILPLSDQNYFTNQTRLPRREAGRLRVCRMKQIHL
jgi:hypothetical protein